MYWKRREWFVSPKREEIVTRSFPRPGDEYKKRRVVVKLFLSFTDLHSESACWVAVEAATQRDAKLNTWNHHIRTLMMMKTWIYTKYHYYTMCHNHHHGNIFRSLYPFFNSSYVTLFGRDTLSVMLQTEGFLAAWWFFFLKKEFRKMQ